MPIANLALEIIIGMGHFAETELCARVEKTIRRPL